MAEKIIAKLRIEKTQFKEPITSAAGLADDTGWEDMPLTYREDVVEIVEADPEEDELYSHENDAPEDYDITGGGLTASGSFIKATREQMVLLMGGAKSGEGDATKYHHGAKKIELNKAIKFTCKDGSVIIIPNAKGSVQLNVGIGKGGLAKFPFKFRCLTASPTWDCDIVM